VENILRGKTNREIFYAKCKKIPKTFKMIKYVLLVQLIVNVTAVTIGKHGIGMYMFVILIGFFTLFVIHFMFNSKKLNSL